MLTFRSRAEEVLATAHQIWQTEREQARRIRFGQSLRQQTAFDDYLALRAADQATAMGDPRELICR